MASPKTPTSSQPPPAIEDLFTTLDRHIHRSEYEQAVKVADQVLSIAPADEDAIRYKVAALIKLDKFDDALSVIHSFHKLPVDLGFQKAYCLYRQNKLDEAFECLRGRERDSETLLLEAQILQNPQIKMEEVNVSVLVSSGKDKRALESIKMDLGKIELDMKADKMNLKLFNSMTNEKKVFKSIEPKKVGLYVCGIAERGFQYDLSNARTAVSYDVLYRYLKHLSYEVNYVRIVPDVDDMIIKRATESGVKPLSLSAQLYDDYLADMSALQCLPPTLEPRVSDHMPEIKNMIEKIIDRGCGYHKEDTIVFSVEESLKYGYDMFPLREEETAKKGATRKSTDFVLWKAIKSDELGWDSLWGKGRPGLFIACSAISNRYLSPRFDIHGGGDGLLFPHHQYELSQTCVACDDGGVNYWLHNQPAKSAKLKAKTKTVREIRKIYHPLVLRHFLMSEHYRSPVFFTPENLSRSSNALYGIYKTLHDLSDALLPYQQAMATDSGKAQLTLNAESVINDLRREFEEKMSDDLNTAGILNGAYLRALEFIKSSHGRLEAMQEGQQRLSLLVSLVEIEKEAKKVLHVLGLQHPSLSYAEILKEMRDIDEAREKFQLAEEANELGESKKRGAVLHFIDDFRPSFYENSTDDKPTIGDMFESAGSMWRTLTAEQKCRYELLAEEEYDLELQKRNALVQEYKEGSKPIVKLNQEPFKQNRIELFKTRFTAAKMNRFAEIVPILVEHIQQSEYEQAVEVADQVLSIAPKYLDAIRCKVAALLQLNKVDEVSAFIKSFRELPIDLGFKKARDLYSENKPDEAVECLRGLSETFLLNAQCRSSQGAVTKQDKQEAASSTSKSNQADH